MTPRAISSGVSCRILFAAPRILNAPIGCRLSAFSQISLPVPYPETPGNAARTKGVFMAMGAMRAAAARIVSMSTSEIVRVLMTCVRSQFSDVRG